MRKSKPDSYLNNIMSSQVLANGADMILMSRTTRKAKERFLNFENERKKRLRRNENKTLFMAATE